MPIIVLSLGQNDDDVYVGKHFQESLYGVHQYRLAVQRQELLGHISSHAQSLSACHQYRVSFHLGQQLRVKHSVA